MPASNVDRSPPPPTGTVTFLFSDIEGSTKLVEALGDRYAGVLQRHRAAMRAAFAEHGGVERGTEGDSFFVAFSDAVEAVAAAVGAARNLAAADWLPGAEVRVRIGLHTGEGRLVEGDYVGMDVHRAARIAAAGHGGQVLISQSTRILVERSLPPGVALRDMGEHRLKDLPAAEHVYQLDIDGLPTDFPPLRSLARTVANLSTQLPSIVGRDDDLATVRGLLMHARLVTITGAGGTGKTRLVQEVARSIVATEPTDATFVPLDALTDAGLIPVEILRALHLDIAAARDPIDRLAEHLGGRKNLLVLDNLEQLPGAGLLVRSLLDRAPTLSVLASSQAALHVAGEQEYALSPLALPRVDSAQLSDAAAAVDSPAVRLFIERAREVRADFELDASNVAAILAIGTRLDGLPLAIELAAAQTKMLSPDAILHRIEGRLDALASRREDLPARQRTLRATVAWSYDLLPEPEQRLFRRLAVFAGGAQLSEVEAIASAEPAVADPITVLETLVDRSLVNVRRGAGADRYRLLESIRVYARELLQERGELTSAARKHASIYRELARLAEPEYYRTSRRIWLDRIAAEHDNLRAALDELVDARDLAEALELSADLWRFWGSRGHLIEGRDIVDQLLAASGAQDAPPVSPFALSRGEEAAGSIRYWTNPDRRAPLPFYERSLEHAIESGDRRREAWARHNLAFVFDFTPGPEFGEPDLERATELRAQALAMFRELDDRRGIAEALWAISGNARVMQNDPQRARAGIEAALAAWGDTTSWSTTWAITSLAMLDALEGQLDAAEEGMLRAADLFVRDRDIAGEMVALRGLGALSALRGDDLSAVRLDAAAVAAARAAGAELPQIPPIVGPISAAKARLSPEELRREQELGVAIGAESILATFLETQRARGHGVGDRPVVR